ncbi:MAG TPA: complex I NDUFA9 subunit family protein [Caulobacteraceae bacterium]
MQGLVTVFGGTGFIGRQVVRALAKRGYRVRAVSRNEGAGYRLRMLGDVGQIETMQANIRVPASIDRALEGAQGCINLVGVLAERGRQGFQSVHVDGARAVARAAAAQDVIRFVQMSSIGADLNARAKYARTKAEGEQAVREAVPSAAVIRSSVVFGPEDHFFNRFGQMAALSPVLPVICGASKMQPIYVGDLAAAVATALENPAFAGQTFEVGGPTTYTFRELMELIKRETGRGAALIDIPLPLARLIAAVGDVQARIMDPILTSDQLLMLEQDNVAAGGLPGLADLGVTNPTHAEAVIPTYLYRYRKGGQYAHLDAGVFSET